MVAPLSPRLGTDAVQGGETQIGNAGALARVAQTAPSSEAPRDTTAAILSLRLDQWDEQPWTDLPTRLGQQAGLTLLSGGPESRESASGEGSDTRVFDGILIIRRWPTAVVLHRLAETIKVVRVPILLCTAAPSEMCASALRLGVADILRHDMHKAEMMARIALRCGAARGMGGAQLAHGPLLLDRMQRMAWHNGRMLRLTALQFDLLAALMAAQGGVVSAEALRQSVWHNARDPGTNRLAVHIHHIRRAIQDAGGGVGVQAEGGGYALTSVPCP